MRLDPKSGYFGSRSPDGVIRTFFRPVGEPEDWRSYFGQQFTDTTTRDPVTQRSSPATSRTRPPSRQVADHVGPVFGQARESGVQAPTVQDMAATISERIGRTVSSQEVWNAIHADPKARLDVVDGHVLRRIGGGAVDDAPENWPSNRRMDGLPGETTVARTVALATETRTPRGAVDEAALERFAAAVPGLEFGGPGELRAALTRLANNALERDGLVLQELAGGGAQGISGAPVFLVSDTSGAVVAVTKHFPKIAELAQELSSIERLGREEFGGFDMPRVLGVARADLPEGTAGALVMSAARGRSLHEVINGARESNDKAEDWRQVRTAVADSAKALAELHSRSALPGRPVSKAYLEGNYRGGRTAAAKLATEHAQVLNAAGIDPDSLRARVDELFEASLADPGVASVVHGDAHAGNIFWAPGAPHAPAGRVTFIDVSLGHFSMDRSGFAIGTPARDTVKLVRWLERYAVRGFELEEAGDLRDSFVEAYRTGGGPAVPEATSTAFTTRYALLAVLGEVNNLAKPKIPKDIRRTLVRQRNYELETLREALGERR